MFSCFCARSEEIYDLRRAQRGPRDRPLDWEGQPRAIGGVKLPIKERTSFLFFYFVFFSLPLSEGSLISSP